MECQSAPYHTSFPTVDFRLRREMMNSMSENYRDLFNISLGQHDSSGLLDWHPYDDLCGYVHSPTVIERLALTTESQ